MMNYRPNTKTHPDDKDVSFEFIKNEFKRDPYTWIDLRIYHNNGTEEENYGIFRGLDEIKFSEDQVIFNKGDKQFIVNCESQLVQNWYANRIGYILAVYCE